MSDYIPRTVTGETISESTARYRKGGVFLSDLALRGTARPDGLSALPRRYELRWVGGARGKPGINADIQNAAEAVRMIADPDFEVLGTNAVTADVIYGVEGGIKVSSHGADLDSTILAPHLDANQSAWTQVTWGTDKETWWECDIATDAAITTSVIWAGLKLTNTPTTATDDDQVFFRYENGVASGAWQYIYSISGTDTATTTGVVVAVSTRYHLKIIIGATRVAEFWVNGAYIGSSTALADAVDLIPYVGVKASGVAAARFITVYGQAISRNIG